MFTIPIYYNKRGKRKIPPHVLAFYSLSYLLLRERPDESPAVPVFCAHNAQAGIEWFVPVGTRSARPGFALKGGGEVARASRAGFRRLRAAGRCRCARRAHYDSLRAAAKRRLLACTLAAAREEGALPPLANHPRRETFMAARDRKQICPHAVENLICNNVAAVLSCV